MNSINQNIEFDIISFAKDILKEIEALRSFNELGDDSTEPGLRTPLESRLNTFFRLIGLPMIVSETIGGNNINKVLTPGFHWGNDLNLKNSELDNPFSNLKGESISKSLSDREEYLRTLEQKIINGDEEINNNMTLAIKKPMPIEANFPASPKDKFDIYERPIKKQLFPLITSFLNVLPKQNEMARPFLKDINKQKIDSRTYLKKPFIETVIKIKVSLSKKNNSFSVDFLNTLSQNSINKDFFNELEFQINNSTDSVIDKRIKESLKNSINQVAKRWSRIKKDKDSLCRKNDFVISAKTQSSKESLFGKKVNISTKLSNNYENSVKMQELIQNKAKEEVLLQLVLPTDYNKSGYSLINPFIKIISSELDIINSQIKDLEDDVTRQTQNMENIRFEMDSFTGEFTGISILDIIAVISGLFFLGLEDLFYLLDEETRDIIKSTDDLKNAFNSYEPSANLERTLSSINKLQLNVNMIYSIFNYYVNIFDKDIKNINNEEY